MTVYAEPQPAYRIDEDSQSRPAVLKVSVNWGKIMSAVLVGNLLAALVIDIVYELMK